MNVCVTLEVVLEPDRMLSDDEIARLEVERYELSFAVASPDARDPKVAWPVGIIAVRCVGVNKI